MTVQALLLDLDDTLIDTRSAMIAAATGSAGAVWPKLEPELAAEVGRHYYFEGWEYFERYADGLLSFEQMRRDRLEFTRAAFGLPTVDCVSAFYAAYGEEFPRRQTVFADTLPLLDAADELGVPMALVTNSSSALTEMKLAATGLSGRFVAEITRDTFGVGKPDPRVFASAVEALGVPASAVLSVGDNLARDVQAAVAFGTRGSWLSRSDAPMTAGRARPADPGVPVITTLAELDLAALAA